MRRIILVGQLNSSSGLLKYIAQALKAKGCEVIPVDAHALFWPKLWPALKAFSPSKDVWYRRRWENNLYSPQAWERNTRLNGRLMDQIRQSGDLVLHMSKEHFPHPHFADMPYYVFVHSCLAIELRGGVAPWVPRKQDQPAFMDLERQLFQNARKVFTGAHYVQEFMRRDYGVNPEKLALGGGAADDYFINNMPSAPANELRKNLIMVGWDYGMKGGPTAVEALSIARKTIPDLTLTLVGPPPETLPDAPGLIKVGPLRDRTRLLQYYRDADIFILPSLYDTFGFVFCEAMSQGLPCIGTEFNAIPEFIEPGINGYLVPRRDPQTLAARIIEFYVNPANRFRMGQSSMQRVHKAFTWDHVADRLLAGMKESL